MNRRLFLRNLGLVAGSLYIPDRFLLRAERYFDREGVPFFKTFPKPCVTVSADEWGTLHIGDPCQGPTDIPTWREYLVEYMGHEPGELTEEFLYDEWGIDPGGVDEVVPEDVYLDGYWLRNESSTACAYHFLEAYERRIGPNLCGPDGEIVGELTFCDCPMIGNESLLATCEGELALSCLQWRLEQLGARCNFEMIR